MVYAVIIIPVFFIRQIYDFIGQDPEVAELASKFIRFVCPGIFFYMHGVTQASAATAMKYTAGMLSMTAVASIVHLIMVIVFVNVYDLGFDGVIYATSIQFFIRWLTMQLYMLTVKPLQEEHGVRFFSKETFENLGY